MSEYTLECETKREEKMTRVILVAAAGRQKRANPWEQVAAGCLPRFRDRTRPALPWPTTTTAPAAQRPTWRTRSSQKFSSSSPPQLRHAFTHILAAVNCSHRLGAVTSAWRAACWVGVGENPPAGSWPGLLTLMSRAWRPLGWPQRKALKEWSLGLADVGTQDVGTFCLPPPSAAATAHSISPTSEPAAVLADDAPFPFRQRCPDPQQRDHKECCLSTSIAQEKYYRCSQAAEQVK